MKAGHVFVFNPSDNGGESLSLTTEVDNDGIISQELELMSYLNSSSFNLCGAVITPKSLRDLADQLDDFLDKNNVDIYTNTGF